MTTAEDVLEYLKHRRSLARNDNKRDPSDYQPVHREHELSIIIAFIQKQIRRREKDPK